MIRKSIYKVDGGKLIKCELEFEENKINKVKLTGDFFVHPEEAINEIEKNLLGCELLEEEIVEKISQVECEMIGVNAKNFAKTILMAAQKSE